MYFKRTKKSYNLDYIEKLFKIIPLVFIFILTLLSVIIAYFILESKERRDIDLLIQNKNIYAEFEKKEQLSSFVNGIEQRIHLKINTISEYLKKNTYNALGNIDSIYHLTHDIKKIKEFLKEYEIKHDIKLTFFKNNDLNVLYGNKNIKYLSENIFGQSTFEYNQLSLKYIYSQGSNNLQQWKNDLKGTIRLSYFDTIKLGNETYSLGTFSKIEDIKLLTKEIVLNKIKNLNAHLNYDIWFLDLSTKDSFNYYKKHQFKNIKNILPEKFTDEALLKYYLSSEAHKAKHNKDIYLNTISNYLLVIENKKAELYNTNDIKSKYNVLLFNSIAIILFFSTLLTLFSFFFSSFTKNILDRYNKKLQKRTDSLTHWKNRFELAIIASNDGLWDIDFQSNKIYFSKKWLEISGYDKNEINDFNDWFALIHNEDKPKVKELFDSIFINKKKSFISEYRLRTKHDGYKWILARGRLFIDKKTQEKRMLMMSMDIDKSKRLKKELMDVELLVEDGKIVIFRLKNDEHLNVQFISKSIKNYGYDKNDFESGKKNFLDLIYDEDIQKIQKIITNALKDDSTSFTFVCRTHCFENKVKWISCRTILIKNHSGEVINFYGYINDITKIKMSEEELKRKVENEVIKNRNKDKLLIQQSKLAAMGEMIGAIAHQWRQPLNNITLFLHFLKDNYSNKDVCVEKIEKYFERANLQINYMSQTIDDFRNFYKPSKNQTSFHINEVISSALDIIKIQFLNENIKLDVQSIDVMITNYENELKQSLLNILNNAKDAILSRRKKIDFDASVDIKVIQKNEEIQIEIENNGGHIPDDIITRIFEPYFTTKFETQGTGIGLYMTKTIIETNMGGKISVENIKEENVRFEILLPIQRSI